MSISNIQICYYSVYFFNSIAFLFIQCYYTIVNLSLSEILYFDEWKHS